MRASLSASVHLIGGLVTHALNRTPISKAYLCVCDGTDAFALVGEEEVDGFEEFMDGAAELLLSLTTGCCCIEPPRLNYVLEDILSRLVCGGAKAQLSTVLYFTS